MLGLGHMTSAISDNRAFARRSDRPRQSHVSRVRATMSSQFVLRCVWSLALCFVALALCAESTSAAHSSTHSMAPTAVPPVAHATIEIKLGFHHCAGSSGGSDRVAAFLTAVRSINIDPAEFLGNVSFHITPFFQECTDFGDTFKVGQARSMAKLVSRDGTNINSTDTVGAALQSSNVHIIVSGGRSSELTHTTPIADINSKLVIAFTATSDALSDTVLFPTFRRVVAPDAMQSRALARMVLRLGWSRVGVLYANEEYGINLATRFSQECADVGIDVAASVHFTAGVNLSSSRGQQQMENIGNVLRQQFGAHNIKVYLLAAAGNDVMTALFAANHAELVRTGYVVLLPDGAFAKARSPEYREVFAQIDGSVGVYPDFNMRSVAANQMHDLWPHNTSAWNDLVNDFDMSTLAEPIAVLSHPNFDVDDIHQWAYYAWDAAVFAARAAVAAWHECSTSEDELEIHCLLAVTDTTTYSGATDTVDVDTSAYGVFNLHNDRIIRAGQILVQAQSTQVNMTPEIIVWSDGSSGRTVGPAWGQTLPVSNTPTSSQLWILTPFGVTVIVFCLTAVVACVGLAWHHIQAEIKKTRPQNLRKVVEELRRVQNTIPDNSAGTVLRRGCASSAPTKVYTRCSTARLSRGGWLLSMPSASDIDVPAELSRDDVVLVGVIGSGHFGQVYRGKINTTFGHARVKTRVNVAIKTVQTESATTGSVEGARRNFLEEAIVTWQFEHANIVQMYGVVTDGFPYLMVLELCSNGSLLNHVKREDVNHSTAHLLGILCGVADGMSYLVSRCFVHRDLAARNILLDDDYRAKICDFGLGRNYQKDAYVYHMASEKPLPIRWTDPCALQHQTFSESSDVWSFGVMVIEVFTNGAQPYGNWPNLLVLNSLCDGYRHPRPERMPEEVYNDIVLPCWYRLPEPDDATATSSLFDLQGDFGVPIEDVSDASSPHESSRRDERITFAHLLTRLTGMCASCADDGSNEGPSCISACTDSISVRFCETPHDYEYSLPSLMSTPASTTTGPTIFRDCTVVTTR